MAWKSRSRGSVSIDVDIGEFDKEDLLQGLVDSHWISEAEAEAIALRAKKNDRSARVLALTDPSVEDLHSAHIELRCGRIFEAKLHLERFLGRDWSGVLAHG